MCDYGVFACVCAGVHVAPCSRSKPKETLLSDETRLSLREFAHFFLTKNADATPQKPYHVSVCSP